MFFKKSLLKKPFNVHQFFIRFFTVLKKIHQTKEKAGFVDDGNFCSNGKLKKEPVGKGTLFFQFCDIENLAKFFPKLAKLVEFTLEREKNPKTFPIFLAPKKKHSLPQRGL
jgi:hypothetical protein